MAFRPRTVLLLIVVFALATRLYNLSYPEAYYFDEVYHAMTAKLVARNDQRAFEWTHGDTIEPNTYVEWLHPPMAKYAQAVSIRIFGETGRGWRMSSVVFGVGVVLMTALLPQRLFGRPWLSVIAAGIVSLDGLLLTQSRIAMNDIHVVFGFLVSLYAYVWYRQKPFYWRLLLVGVAIGLTIATKWSGIFVWASIGFFELIALSSQLYTTIRVHKLSWPPALIFSGKHLLFRAAALLIIPLLIYVGSYLQMFLQGKDLAYFVELHQQIFAYQFNLTATHPYQSRPLEWVFDTRPVWYFVEYLPEGRRADIYNFGNPLIYWVGVMAVVGTLAVLIYQWWLHLKSAKQKVVNKPSRKKSAALLLSPMELPPKSAFALSLLVTTYLLTWLPWQFSPRIMFSYHYAPAVPLLSILIAYWAVKIWKYGRWSRVLLLSLAAITVMLFIMWYPHWVAIPVSSAFADSVYFALPSWR
jgi:dolichyl-phosphate-mannose--protein O-mannosyl transferase